MTLEEKGKYSKNKILDAAMECLKIKGIERTTINEICKKAGLTRGAFYHHFDNKQHLLSDLFKRWLEGFPSKYDISKVDTSDPQKLLLDIVEMTALAFKKAGKQIPIFLELNIRAINDKKLRTYMLQDQKNFMSIFSYIISKDKKRSSIDSVKPEEIARILFALNLGFAMLCQLNPRAVDWTDLAKKSVKLLLQ